MAVILETPLPLVDAGDLIDRLNARQTSRLVYEYAVHYATQPWGTPSARQWTRADLDEMRRDLATYPLHEYTVAALSERTEPPGLPMWGRLDGAEATKRRPALDWLALAGLVVKTIPLRICPGPGCGKFFPDDKHRGKRTCSLQCAARVRFRKHYAKLKASPRKLRRHRRRQRDLMRRRRAAGLA